MVDTDQHIRRGLSGPFECGRGTVGGCTGGVWVSWCLVRVSWCGCLGALVRPGCLVRVPWCGPGALVPLHLATIHKLWYNPLLPLLLLLLLLFHTDWVDIGTPFRTC